MKRLISFAKQGYLTSDKNGLCMQVTNNMYLYKKYKKKKQSFQSISNIYIGCNSIPDLLYDRRVHSLDHELEFDLRYLMLLGLGYLYQGCIKCSMNLGTCLNFFMRIFFFTNFLLLVLNDRYIEYV